MFCFKFNKESLVKKLRKEKSKYILRKLNKKILPKVFKNDLDAWVKEYKHSSGITYINETQFIVYDLGDIFHTSVKLISSH